MRPISSMTARFAVLFFPLLLASCVLFYPGERPNPEATLPKAFSLYQEGKKFPDRWWQSFSSAELNALIAEALENNLDLTVVWARLRQIRAQTLQTAASLYPDLSLAGEGSYQRLRRAHKTQETEGYLLGLMSGYELDLWGRIRSEREAAVLAEQAAAEDVRTAAMTVAAETARRWVEIVSLRLQKRLLEQQLEANRIYLELVELRFFMSMGSALDVYQQKQMTK